MKKKDTAQLLRCCEEWLAAYGLESPEEQATHQKQYAQISQLANQLENTPKAEALVDAELIEAAEAFWAAVRYAQAVLVDDQLF